MKKFLITLVAVLSFVTVDAQLIKSSYFMEGSVVRSNLNPAFRPTRGYINIPVLGAMNVDFQSGFAIDDLLFKKDGKLVTFLDSAVTEREFFDKIGLTPGKAYAFDMNVATNVLGGGFYLGKSFFSLGVDADIAFGAAVPGDMFRFLKSGSGANGYTFNLASTKLSIESASKIALGYSLKLPFGLTVGARANLKLGFFRANLSFEQFDAAMEQTHWAVDANGVLDVMMPFSGTPDFIGADGKIDFGKIQDAMMSSLKKVRPVGTGFGIDLGAEYDFGFLKASLSLLDLGKMKWNNNFVWRGRAQSHYIYDGFNVENGQDVNGQTSPDLSKLLQFQSETVSGGESITTPMQATIVAGVEFDLLRQIIGLGLVYMDKNREFTSSSQLSAVITLRPLPFLSGSLSYTFENYRNIGANSFNTFGAALNLHTAWLNFFIGTDFIMNHFGKIPVSGSFNVPIPVSQKYFNFYLGIAVPLGKGK